MVAPEMVAPEIFAPVLGLFRCGRRFWPSVQRHFFFLLSLAAEVSEQERKAALTWMRSVHRDLKNQDTSWPFVEPVNRDTTPLYYEIIRNPVDLKMIGQKIREKVGWGGVGEEGVAEEKDTTAARARPTSLALTHAAGPRLRLPQVYQSKAAFIEDVNLMFANCRRFNEESTDYYQCAEALQAYFLYGGGRGGVGRLRAWACSLRSVRVSRFPLPPSFDAGSTSG